MPIMHAVIVGRRCSARTATLSLDGMDWTLEVDLDDGSRFVAAGVTRDASMPTRLVVHAVDEPAPLTLDGQVGSLTSTDDDAASSFAAESDGDGVRVRGTARLWWHSFADDSGKREVEVELDVCATRSE